MWGRTLLLQLKFSLACSLCVLAQPAAVKPRVTPSDVSVTAATKSSVPNTAGAPEWLIGTGDLLQFRSKARPTITKEVRVTAAGKVLLPLVREMHLAGLSASQAQTQIAVRLAKGGFFNHPQVSVFQKEYASQGISILGEVQKPGVYSMLSSPTLFGLISAAGGVTPKAGNTVIITHRDKSLPEQQIQLAHDQNEWPRSNVPLQPGDTVLITKAGIVYVVGEVRQPGGFVMERACMTVLQAIAMAQGASPNAALNHAKVIRGTAAGPKASDIALKDILSDGRPMTFSLSPRANPRLARAECWIQSSKSRQGVAIYR